MEQIIKYLVFNIYYDLFVLPVKEENKSLINKSDIDKLALRLSCGPIVSFINATIPNNLPVPSVKCSTKSIIRKTKLEALKKALAFESSKTEVR